MLYDRHKQKIQKLFGQSLTNYRLLLIPLCLVTLSACASTISSAVYETIQNQQFQLHAAKVLSSAAPYKITWTTQLGHAESTPEIKPRFVVISQGQYRNWTWTVKGTPLVLASWKKWLSGGAQQTSVRNVTLNWEHGFKVLWKISHYLLAEKPLPAKITLTLLPDNQAHEATITRSNPNKVPVVFSAWYPTTKEVSYSAAEKRFQSYAESLAVAGGLLERVELAKGAITAPSHGAARTIKDRANAFCWRLAGRPAIAAGTNFKLKPITGTGHAAITVLKDIYNQKRSDLLAQELYAVALTLHNANQYLAYLACIIRHDKREKALNVLKGV